MGAFSIWHWAVVVGWLVGGAIPIFLLQRRLGQRGLLSLVALIPLGLFVALWVVAYSRWPSEERTDG
jgi:hypothetical protein